MYSFEFLPNFSDKYNVALSEYNQAEKINKVALNIVKEKAKGTPEGDRYAKTFTEASLKWRKYQEIKNEEKVFAFKSLQLFLGEFGPMFCFFLYSLFMLFRSFYFERKNIGMKILHGLIISGTMFYFFWMFEMSDFNKIAYYLMTFISGFFIVIAVSLITKYQDHIINRLKKQKFKISKFAFLNTKDEKRDEMLKTLKEVNS